MTIKAGKLNKVKSIKSPIPKIDVLRSFLNNHPVFCFQFLQNGFTIDTCSREEKAGIVKKICDLSGMTWAQIRTERRDAIGAEKIPYSSIKAGKPSWITKDSEFLSFRFCGDNCRFLGYQNDFIFHVIYIDPHLRAYKH